jgi:hypothetical protein
MLKLKNGVTSLRWNVFVVVENPSKVWIQDFTREGGEFDCAAFENAIGMSVDDLSDKATEATLLDALKAGKTIYC